MKKFNFESFLPIKLGFQFNAIMENENGVQKKYVRCKNAIPGGRRKREDLKIKKNSKYFSFIKFFVKNNMYLLTNFVIQIFQNNSPGVPKNFKLLRCDKKKFLENL